MEVYSTSFGMYALFDFDTYKAIKRYKALLNVLEMKRARVLKDDKKMLHNRKFSLETIKGMLGEVFYEYASEDKPFTHRKEWWEDEARVYFAKEKNASLAKDIMEIWDAARKIYATEEEALAAKAEFEKTAWADIVDSIVSGLSLWEKLESDYDTIVMKRSKVNA